MFKTLIILYARSFWITASRSKRSRALAGVHVLKSFDIVMVCCR